MLLLMLYRHCSHYSSLARTLVLSLFSPSLPQAIGYSEEKAAEVFDSIDEDKGGEISKDEFIDFFAAGNNIELFRKLRYGFSKVLSVAKSTIH